MLPSFRKDMLPPCLALSVFRSLILNNENSVRSTESNTAKEKESQLLIFVA